MKDQPMNGEQRGELVDTIIEEMVKLLESYTTQYAITRSEAVGIIEMFKYEVMTDGFSDSGDDDGDDGDQPQIVPGPKGSAKA